MKEKRRKDLFTNKFKKFSEIEASAIDGINYLKKIDLNERELDITRDELAKQFNVDVEKVSYGDIYWRLLNKRSIKYFSIDTERYAWNQVAMSNFLFDENKITRSIEILMSSYKLLLDKKNIHSPYIDFNSDISIEMGQLEFWQGVYLDIIIGGLRDLNEDVGGDFVLKEIEKKYPKFLLKIKEKFIEFNKNIEENKRYIEEIGEKNVDEENKIVEVNINENNLVASGNNKKNNFFWIIIIVVLIWLIFF